MYQPSKTCKESQTDTNDRQNCKTNHEPDLECALFVLCQYRQLLGRHLIHDRRKVYSTLRNVETTCNFVLGRADRRELELEALYLCIVAPRVKKGRYVRHCALGYLLY